MVLDRLPKTNWSRPGTKVASCSFIFQRQRLMWHSFLFWRHEKASWYGGLFSSINISPQNPLPIKTPDTLGSEFSSLWWILLEINHDHLCTRCSWSRHSYNGSKREGPHPSHTNFARWWPPRNTITKGIGRVVSLAHSMSPNWAHSPSDGTCWILSKIEKHLSLTNLGGVKMRSCGLYWGNKIRSFLLENTNLINGIVKFNGLIQYQG